MFTLFSGRHIGVPRRYTNMAFSYWALQISAKHFDEYLKFGETHTPKTWRRVLFSCLLQHHNFIAFSTRWFSIYFFFCVTVKTIYLGIICGPGSFADPYRPVQNLSNDNANAEDDAQSKMNLHFTSEFRRCLDLFD